MYCSHDISPYYCVLSLIYRLEVVCGRRQPADLLTTRRVVLAIDHLRLPAKDLEQFTRRHHILYNTVTFPS